MAAWWGENWQWVLVGVVVPIAVVVVPSLARRRRAARALRWHAQPQTDGTGTSCKLTVVWMLAEPALEVNLDPAGGARMSTVGGSSARRLEEGESRMAVFRWGDGASNPRAVLTWREAGVRKAQRLEFDLLEVIEP